MIVVVYAGAAVFFFFMIVTLPERRFKIVSPLISLPGVKLPGGFMAASFP